jgi:hypothetical protein
LSSISGDGLGPAPSIRYYAFLLAPFPTRVSYPKVIEKRIQAIYLASALTCDPAVIESNRLVVEALVQQLRVLLQAVDRFEHQIAGLAPTLP